ncbi:MAG: hypothetical protein LUC95_03900 [Lachnospiraceae bacterium]|nr:hypothetical protein [Lachnospiraceae bacterium]
MRISPKLLLGSSIDDPDTEGLKNDMQNGRLPFSSYVLVYSAVHTLEIYSFRMLHYNPDVLKNEDCAVGLASSKEEAYSLVLEVMDQIYALGKYKDLPHFMEEQLGVKT